MMKRLIILFQLCIFSLLAVGQTMEVHGRVLDGAQKGEPMIGATVMVKGTNQGTVTDIDGLFVLQVPKNAVLVISSVGYKTQEVKANKVEVPDVTDMDSSDAIKLLKQKGLNYKIAPEPEDGKEDNFVVLDQNPKEGTKVDKDSVVYIYSE